MLLGGGEDERYKVGFGMHRDVPWIARCAGRTQADRRAGRTQADPYLNESTKVGANPRVGGWGSANLVRLFTSEPG